MPVASEGDEAMKDWLFERLYILFAAIARWLGVNQ